MADHQNKAAEYIENITVNASPALDALREVAVRCEGSVAAAAGFAVRFANMNEALEMHAEEDGKITIGPSPALKAFITDML